MLACAAAQAFALSLLQRRGGLGSDDEDLNDVTVCLHFFCAKKKEERPFDGHEISERTKEEEYGLCPLKMPLVERLQPFPLSCGVSSKRMRLPLRTGKRKRNIAERQSDLEEEEEEEKLCLKRRMYGGVMKEETVTDVFKALYEPTFTKNNYKNTLQRERKTRKVL